MRVYHGCPDSRTKQQWDREKALEAKLKALEPEAHLTWFPMEQKFRVAIWGTALSRFHESKMNALQDAINHLERRTNDECGTDLFHR